MKVGALLDKTYTVLAKITLGIIIFFILANIVLGFLYLATGYVKRHPLSYSGEKLFKENGSPVQTGQRDLYQLEWFDFNACKEIGEKYASDVLDDFYQLGKRPQQWVRFYYPPFHGKKVNIVLGEKGFPRRKTLNPAREVNKPVIRIYTLGSSTTFGLFVSDEHTWSSYLSYILNERAKKEGKSFNVEVTNFGRASYYPGQETTLIFNLLRSGHRPSLVIFEDGFNWQTYEDDVPGLSTVISDELLACYYNKHFSVKCLALSLQYLPVYKTIQSLSFRLQKALNLNFEKPQDNSSQPSFQPRPLDDMRHVTNHFDLNRKLAKAICSVYGAKTMFVLQPHPRYKYNLNLFRDGLAEKLQSDNDQLSIDTLYNAIRKNKEYLDLSTVYEKFGSNKKAYIDDYHYSPAFGKFLAEQIASNINLNTLPVLDEVFDESKSPESVRVMLINRDF
ncbi:MAG: hypothetical protein HY094_01300 [Candidatus Melainabacteria bacterium]|nr:hypothetical protein [Candidatus Melainabacteria bacterium]